MVIKPLLKDKIVITKMIVTTTNTKSIPDKSFILSFKIFTFKPSIIELCIVGPITLHYDIPSPKKLSRYLTKSFDFSVFAWCLW